VAIVPSAVQINRYSLRNVKLTYKGRPLREPLAIFWDRRRPLPRYAVAFCEMLADHMRAVFPISRPSEADRNPKLRQTLRRALRKGGAR
jgi:hypothetical protein